MFHGTKTKAEHTHTHTSVNTTNEITELIFFCVNSGKMVRMLARKSKLY